jgi:hypothetical protein
MNNRKLSFKIAQSGDRGITANVMSFAYLLLQNRRVYLLDHSVFFAPFYMSVAFNNVFIFSSILDKFFFNKSSK